MRSEFPELTSAELLILEGAQAIVGIESTILDISDAADNASLVILRPGHISAEQIAQVLGRMPTRSHAGSPQVSGTLKAHYAPRTPLRLIPSHGLSAAIRSLSEMAGTRIAALVFDAPADAALMNRNIDYYLCERDAQAYAHELYATLRRLDQKGYTTLLLEHPPETSEWAAVNDRLSRAAAAFS